MTLSSKAIITKRNKFWQSKQHKVLTPASLIADKESTALFTVAWMQPLIPYLTGQKHPLGQKLYNIQACIRTNDIEEVGDDSHHTMFFMMGNRSLGDYFKEISVQQSREFLTQELWLDARKFAVTVFEGDQEVPADKETAWYWKNLWIPSHKISYLDAKDNWRSPGAVGPCWPCTEIYYWIGDWDFPTEADNVAENEDNRLEIRNNVFMEFYRDQEGKLTKLEKQNVDTGMGLERLVKVLQDTPSPYETDLFMPLIQHLEQVTNLTYTKHTAAFRIIVDHIRSAGFLIAEWLHPSNEGRWYVLRRLLRNSYAQLYELLHSTHNKEQLLAIYTSNIPILVEHYKSRNPILDWTIDTITTLITKELQQFASTLHQWKKLLNKYLSELPKKATLSWDKVFKLYDTFGFPPELTEDFSKQQWITIDMLWYQKSLHEAKERSRIDTISHQSKEVNRSEYIHWLPSTTFLWYSGLESQSTLLKRIDFDDYSVLIFDKTPFYATRGWQIHDIGSIEADNQSYEVFDVQDYSGVYLHFVKETTDF